MNIIFILIPLGLLLLGIAVAAFFWAVRSGQYDDLESPGWDPILDDDRAPPDISAGNPILDDDRAPPDISAGNPILDDDRAPPDVLSGNPVLDDDRARSEDSIVKMGPAGSRIAAKHTELRK